MIEYLLALLMDRSEYGKGILDKPYCFSYNSNMTAFDIAHQPLPGKFERGQCAVYARELSRKLDDAKVLNHIILEDSDSQEYRYHATVVFYHGHKWYRIDNETWKPKVVNNPMAGVIIEES